MNMAEGPQKPSANVRMFACLQPVGTGLCRLTQQLHAANRYARARFCRTALKYLAYCPRTQRSSVPLVVYFAGSGEVGTNLVSLLRQTTILKKVTDPDFQKRHPCYLLMPQLPKGMTIHSGCPGKPNALAHVLKSLIDSCCRSATRPSVDTNCIYITGLSYGGSVAFELPAYYPGYFAASVPISSFMNALMVPETNACQYWLFYNKTSFVSEQKKHALNDLRASLQKAGGGLRVSTFPVEGHNAWDRAWKEDSTWDWLFGQRLGRGHELRDAKCSSNFEWLAENGMSPYNVIDGLKSTEFVSADNVGSGAYWLCEFANKMSGRWRVEVGRSTGLKCSRYEIYVSQDGVRWRRKVSVTANKGFVEFSDLHGFRLIKVQYEGVDPGVFCLRNVKRVANK